MLLKAPLRVLVTGGRNYTDGKHVWLTLDALHAETRITVIIHGGARGADRLAADWARFHGVLNIEIRPNWSLGPRAGPMRNRRLLIEGRPDCVVAFPGGAGTANMIEQAMARGIPIIRRRPVRAAV